MDDFEELLRQEPITSGSLACTAHGPMLRRPDSDLTELQIKAGRWWACPRRDAIPSCDAMAFIPSAATQRWFTDRTAPADLMEALAADTE